MIITKLYEAIGNTSCSNLGGISHVITINFLLKHKFWQTYNNIG